MKDKIENIRFRKIGLYVLNRLTYTEFRKALVKAYGEHLNDEYLEEKWEKFRDNSLSFLVSHKEIVDEIEKEIIRTGYKK